jgi:hypothetical protein
MDHPVNLMRFRFTICDLFWLTLLVGMALTWIASIHLLEQRHEDESRAAISKIVELKGDLSRMAADKAGLVRLLQASRPEKAPAEIEP